MFHGNKLYLFTQIRQFKVDSLVTKETDRSMAGESKMPTVSLDKQLIIYILS